MNILRYLPKFLLSGFHFEFIIFTLKSDKSLKKYLFLNLFFVNFNLKSKMIKKTFLSNLNCSMKNVIK